MEVPDAIVPPDLPQLPVDRMLQLGKALRMNLLHESPPAHEVWAATRGFIDVLDSGA
jgi:hypothetical protein